MNRVKLSSRVGNFHTTFNHGDAADFALAKREIKEYEDKFYADVEAKYVRRTLSAEERFRGGVSRVDTRTHFERATAENWTPRKAIDPAETTQFSPMLANRPESMHPLLLKAMKIKDPAQRHYAMAQFLHDQEIVKRKQATAPQPLLESADYKALQDLSEEINWDCSVPTVEVDLYRQALAQHEYPEACAAEAAKLASDYFEARESRLKAISDEQDRKLAELDAQRAEILGKRLRKTKREEAEELAANEAKAAKELEAATVLGLSLEQSREYAAIRQAEDSKSETEPQQ